MRRANGWITGLLLAAAVAARAGVGPPVDPDAGRAPDLVEVTAVDPSLRLDVRYATRANFTGRVLYASARAFLQRPAAQALARAQRRLRLAGYGIVVLDAYRPWRVTKALWDATPPAGRGFVADPARGSRHNRGAAVDVTLATLATGEMAAMPSDYDEMTERASPTYGGGDAAARERRDTLRAAMEGEGFFVHPAEWWHFDWKDWGDYPVLNLPFDAIAREPAAVESVDPREARLVDLTHPFDDRTLYWPSATSGFVLERLAYGTTPVGFFYAANAFTAPEHGGTHLDAPIHFARDRWTVDAVPLERLAGPGVVLDVTEAAQADRDHRVSVADVRRFEARHGRIPPGAIVLVRTGWGAYWPNRGLVFGDETPGRTDDLHFPGYGRAAAELLVRERRVAALGIDTPSLDHGPSSDFAAHRVAAAANVVGLENVANLDALPDAGSWIVALPMKIGGGSGAPVRVVAFVPR